MDQALQIITQAALVLIAAVTLADYAYERDPRRRDVALLFGSLGWAIAIGWLAALAGQQETRGIAVITGLLVLAQPCLLLRVTAAFCAVPRWTLFAALAGMLLSWGLIVVMAPPVPAVITIPIVAYFALGDGYASVLLVRGALEATGERRRRLSLAAAGSALLAGVLLLAGIQTAAPETAVLTKPVSSVVSMLCAVAYYFGFAPPNWIRDNWIRLPLSSQVVALVTAVALLTAGASTAAVAIQLRDASIAQLQTQQTSLAQATAGSVREHLANARTGLQLVASRGALEGAVRGDNWDLPPVYDALDDLLTTYPSMRNAFAIDARGVLRANGSRDLTTIGIDLANREYFQGVIRSRAPYVSAPFVAVNPPGPTFVVGVPVFDNTGSIRAVLAASFAVDRLTKEFGLVGPTAATRLSVVARGGLIAIDTDPSRLLSPAASESVWAEAALGGAAGANLEQAPGGGEDRFVAYAPIPDLGWAVLVITPQDDILSAITEAERRAALLGLMLVIGFAGAAGVIGARLLRSLGALTIATTKFAAGDYAARVPVGGPSDLRALTVQFNTMAGELGHKDAALRQQAEELHVANRELRALNQTLEQRVAERTADVEARAQDLARSNAELEQFAYVASHDLQEPLRVVGSFAQMLARRYRGQLDADADRFIGHVTDGASRMQRLINDLLTYSRVATRANTPEATDCDAVVAQAADNLGEAIAETGAEVTHDPLPIVPADKGQLTQVFQNLIANGIKFHGAEPPRVHVSAERQNGDYVFSVRDNGIGFEPAYADRIFVIFQRLWGVDEYPGTGIGLALCKRIVERHGGRIWVTSAPDEGSIFSFSIPAESSPAEGGSDACSNTEAVPQFISSS
ncbi:MAG: hypothetical protein QOF51_2130 [Chloroflexota bacterium]|jgi:signal transduction histidine kinase|nr:hypothetical protein [Chloroflexota bacterium]